MWIYSEISTKLLGMPTHIDRSSLTALDPISCQLVTSAVRCRLATRVTLCQLTSVNSFVQLLLAFPSYFRSRRDRGFRPLFCFAPKQTNGSSAWWTTNIVSQTFFFIWHLSPKLEREASWMSVCLCHTSCCSPNDLFSSVYSIKFQHITTLFSYRSKSCFFTSAIHSVCGWNCKT